MAVRVRYEYRAIQQNGKLAHAVYDTWYNKIRTTLSSKYACKQYIKRHQEEIEVEE